MAAFSIENASSLQGTKLSTGLHPSSSWRLKSKAAMAACNYRIRSSRIFQFSANHTVSPHAVVATTPDAARQLQHPHPGSRRGFSLHQRSHTSRQTFSLSLLYIQCLPSRGLCSRCLMNPGHHSPTPAQCAGFLADQVQNKSFVVCWTEVPDVAEYLLSLVCTVQRDHAGVAAHLRVSAVIWLLSVLDRKDLCLPLCSVALRQKAAALRQQVWQGLSRKTAAIAAAGPCSPAAMPCRAPPLTPPRIPLAPGPAPAGYRSLCPPCEPAWLLLSLRLCPAPIACCL